MTREEEIFKAAHQTIGGDDFFPSAKENYFVEGARWADSHPKNMWKPITEIPTEHWDKNEAISPLYLVRCGTLNGVSVLGYSNYSFVTKEWIPVAQTTAFGGVREVTEWTDLKI